MQWVQFIDNVKQRSINSPTTFPEIEPISGKVDNIIYIGK